MEIRHRQTGPIAILELAGRLTVNDQPGMLKAAVVSAVEGGARHVLLDLSGVFYIDSTRLGEIIASHVTVTRRGGHLRLFGTPPRIAELFAIAGLEGVFDRYDTAEEAAKQVN